LLLLGGVPASAVVLGGGPTKTDCYAVWEGVTANHGKNRVDCQDGDPSCDVDGVVNGVCRLGIGICLFQNDVPGCTPEPIEKATATAKPGRIGRAVPVVAPTPPPTPVSTPTCGSEQLLTLPLKVNGKGVQKPSKVIALTMTAKGAKKKDKDTLKVQCVPNKGRGQCPVNPAGGPRQAILTVRQEGTDLDTGWTGVSHNFPVVYGTVLSVCLKDCDPSTNPLCTEDAATDQVNGSTFGAPLPLFTVAPVCIVNRFATPKITDATIDLRTGAVSSTLHLLTDVYITVATNLCPRCSGAAIGQVGTCNAGARSGLACRTEGIVTVETAPGDKVFTLSSDCPPSGQPAGTISITLPMTTGASTLPGPRPCGAAQDDDCRGGTCSATCTGSACASMFEGQCVASLGGISQVCCSSNTIRSCFPTAAASGGMIVRTGTPGVPAPSWPDPGYPKSASATLAASFCSGSTGSTVVDATTGLPGPGALLLPVDEQLVK
jgi:hypothetical protein